MTSFVLGAIALVLASTVHRSSPERSDNRIYAVMAGLSAVGIWGEGIARLCSAGGHGAEWLAGFAQVAGIVVLLLMALFSFSFPFGRRLARWAVGLSLAATVGLGWAAVVFRVRLPWGSFWVTDLAVLFFAYQSWKGLGSGRERTGSAILAVSVLVRWAWTMGGWWLGGQGEAAGERLTAVVVQTIAIGLLILWIHRISLLRVLREATIPLTASLLALLYGAGVVTFSSDVAQWLGSASGMLLVIVPPLLLGWGAWAFADAIHRRLDGMDPERAKRRALLERVLSVTGQVIDPEAVLAMVQAAVCEAIPNAAVGFAKSSRNQVLSGISRQLSVEAETHLENGHAPVVHGWTIRARVPEGASGPHALIVVRRQNSVLGAFDVKGVMRDDELETVRALADHLAVKFENHALYSSLGKAGRELASIKSFLEDLIESLPVGIVGLVGDEHRVKLWNPVEERRTGISKLDAIGKRYIEDLACHSIGEPIAGVLRDRPVDAVHVSDIVSGEGAERRNLDVIVAPLRLKASEFGGYVLIINDVTQQIAMQRELEESSRLASLGRFAAAVAHDIRTPLSSIRMSVQILRSKLELSADDMEYFDLTLEAIGRLGRDVEELLDFTKPIVLREDSVRVEDLVEDVRATVAARAAERKAQVVAELAEPELTVPIDEARIRQALVNLVDNALQATGEGGTVRMVGECRDEYVVISVIDTGAGIDEKNLERIWDPFFTTKPDGTGLGLAIVKKVVMAHGGQILVRSQPGIQTCFDVYLPAKRATEVVVMLNETARPSTSVA